jgi:hypothetical protein
VKLAAASVLGYARRNTYLLRSRHQCGTHFDNAGARGQSMPPPGFHSEQSWVPRAGWCFMPVLGSSSDGPPQFKSFKTEIAVLPFRDVAEDVS